MSIQNIQVSALPNKILCFGLEAIEPARKSDSEHRSYKSAQVRSILQVVPLFQSVMEEHREAPRG